MATVAVDARAAYRPPRWLLITTGIIWLLVAVAILSMDATSVVTIGYLCGFVLIFGGVAEFIELGAAPGWKWLHAVLGVLFVLTGIGALLSPFQTFGILALLVGWFLVFKGVTDLTAAIVFRDVQPLWGLALGVGIIEAALGVWAIGYPGRSSWLLLIWVGVGALVRGVGSLVAAFTQKGVA
jgi:uncharacterized membrane protein HdeD (DUF308 family)